MNNWPEKILWIFFVNYQLARLYQQIGKTVRAIGIYDRLYQTDTTNVILLKRIGDCYNRIGWSMNAVDHYLRAVCLDPEDGETVVKAVNLMMANISVPLKWDELNN